MFDSKGPPGEVRPSVFGRDVDKQTRCAHYHSPLDIVAIKHPCCDRFYACIRCHDEMAGHASDQWPRECFGQQAVLCGACSRRLTIQEYLTSGHRCPACNSPFNPRCAGHYHLYFETD